MQRYFSYGWCSFFVRSSGLISLRWFLLVFMLMVTACSQNHRPLNVDTGYAAWQSVTDYSSYYAANFKMDSTVGSYGAGREDGLILVTINSDQHRKLVETDKISPDALPSAYTNLMSDWYSQFNISRVADWPVPPLDAHCLIFEVGGLRNRDSIVAALNEMAIVDTAQPVKVFQAQQSEQYNDPYLPLQHAIRSMRADYTHRWSSGRGVSVAVIDTGVDISHPEFAERILDARNYVDSDDDQFRSDVHGTAVAGVIGAAVNNETGMVGIAPSARLFPMKACWQADPEASHAVCNSITLLKALDDSIQQEVDIINLSLAGPRDPLLEQLVDEAISRNIIVVGARSPSDPDTFPTAVEGIIAVSDQSNREAGVLMAPGKKVLSLHPQNAYEFYDGSSFSTAHIAGVVALIRELSPEVTAAEAESLIKATSDYGTGSANACRAISYMVKSDMTICDQ